MTSPGSGKLLVRRTIPATYEFFCICFRRVFRSEKSKLKSKLCADPPISIGHRKLPVPRYLSGAKSLKTEPGIARMIVPIFYIRSAFGPRRSSRAAHACPMPVQAFCLAWTLGPAHILRSCGY